MSCVIDDAESFWQSIESSSLVDNLSGTLHRLVESQGQIATRELVSGDLQKQQVLEELLEPSKPPVLPGTEHLDYLLATPWRYPPLLYGSRYGRYTEPSLFYGGIGVATTLAESAYYRWVFYFDMAEPVQLLSSQHTLFEAEYLVSKGVRLHDAKFEAVQGRLTDRSNYQFTQHLGSVLRAAGIEAFEFPSARDPEHGNNVALLVPTALSSSSAQNKKLVFCSTTKQQVVFRVAGGGAAVFSFSIEDFYHNNRFPRPASH